MEARSRNLLVIEAAKNAAFIQGYEDGERGVFSQEVNPLYKMEYKVGHDTATNKRKGKK